ncbi:MAG: hypothetical protein H7Y60_01835 [Rhodospirillaceae bacterium]|nr:hypothetical protein [Rhodospirillales bacterium]
MKDVLKGNFTTREKIAVAADSAETLEEKFERTAKARLGGSVAYVSKKRVAWTDDSK